MQEETKTELNALLDDLNLIVGRVGPHNALEQTNPATREVLDLLMVYRQKERNIERMRENAAKLTVPELVDSHNSSLEDSSESPIDVNDKSSSDEEMLAAFPSTLEDWFMVPEPQGFLHELLNEDKYLHFRTTPTAMSEILALYFFLKSQSMNPKSASPVYMHFIDRCLVILSEGSLAFLINKLPKFSGHNYTLSLAKVLKRLQKVDELPDNIARSKLKALLKSKLFKVIDRHLLSFTTDPIAKLEAYITKKTFQKNLDNKLACAKDLCNLLYQHTIKCYYQNYPARESVEYLISIIIKTTQHHLDKKLHELDGYYRQLILSILAYIDQSSTEHMIHVTNYRALISATVGFDRSTNRVAHLSGHTFSPNRFNKFQLFNNAASSDFANSEGDAFFQIMTAIENAERFIFILGWEFSPQLIYHRKDNPDARTLGEILIDKAIANPNLNIAIMVWGQQVMYTNVGADMHAHSLAYLTELAWKRHKKKHLPSNLSLQFANRSWVYFGVNSHHQKMVLTDQAQLPFVVGFLGGLDLTIGRFDANHQLILQEEYLEKYHQTQNKTQLAKSLNGGQRRTHADICNLDVGNPFRTPWHDIHCRVEGNVCLDLLTHFQQHWGAHDQSIFKNSRIKNVIDSAFQLLQQHADFDLGEYIWTSQVLRSHTHANCKFWKLNSPFENSILDGYLRIIQKAEHFIYIENQYFIGGGKNVHDEKRFGNLIPNAIFKKIIDKHNKREDFHVYITLPLFPEGGPESSTDNAVRREQHNTMHWLIKELNKHTDNNSHRYISFLWLGEWNGKTEHYDELAQQNHATRKALIAESRRYPIYVHSKFILVDDKYLIVGSANINERSMMGIRDSEIAVLQGPVPGKEHECQQALLAFRTSLWRQYFGQYCLDALGPEGIANPHTTDAIHVIQQTGRYNLTCFMQNAQSREAGQGHLMVWPYMMPEQMELALKKLPDTPLSQANNPAYNWMLDKDNLRDDEYTSKLESWFLRNHADIK